MIPLFTHIRENTRTLFRGRYLLMQVVAIGLSIFIVMSGLDWSYYVATRGIPGILIFPGIMLGGILPVLGLPLLLATGKILKRESLVLAAWVMGQAAFLGWALSSLYKAFTGRIPPPFRVDNIATDISHGFRFGFMEGGIFWGWPSSHTTVAFAMACALQALYPTKKILGIIAILYAVMIGISTSVSIHWLSESVAGVLFGTAVGHVVGLYFRTEKASAKSA